MSIKIVTDSTAYLTRELIEELGIEVVSLSVHFPESSHKESEITNEEFYEKMDKSPNPPTSSQPSPADFYKIFAGHAKEGDPAAGVFISSEFSGTYSSALTAKKMVNEEYPQAQIEIIDSRSTAMQLGYAVLAGAKAAKDGCPFDAVVARIKETLARSRLYFVPKTLEYLKKGGRIGEAAAIVGTLLQLKPILTVTNGIVTVFEKVRTSEKAINRIMAVFEEDLQKSGIDEITVHHINCLEEAEKIEKQIKEKYGLTPMVTPIGPVVGLHAGPGTLGLAYVLKNRES